MEKRITNAVYALYGGAVISLAVAISNYLEFQKLRGDLDMSSSYYTYTSLNLDFPALSFLILVATYFVAQELRAKKKWSWISALTLLLLNATGISVLFSIFGAIQLLDREVREYFLKQMDIDLG